MPLPETIIFNHSRSQGWNWKGNSLKPSGGRASLCCQSPLIPPFQTSNSTLLTHQGLQNFLHWSHSPHCTASPASIVVVSVVQHLSAALLCSSTVGDGPLVTTLASNKQPHKEILQSTTPRRFHPRVPFAPRQPYCAVSEWRKAQWTDTTTSTVSLKSVRLIALPQHTALPQCTTAPDPRIKFARSTQSFIIKVLRSFSTPIIACRRVSFLVV